MRQLVATACLVNLVSCADPSNPNHTIDSYISKIPETIICMTETDEPIVSEAIAFDGFFYIGTIKSFDLEGRQTVVALQYEDYGASEECSDQNTSLTQNSVALQAKMGSLTPTMD